MKFLIFILLIISSVACNNNNSANDDNNVDKSSNATPIIYYATTAMYPHDTTSYTEGFLIHEGKFFESTGYDSSYPQTRSLFGELDLKTGKIAIRVELDRKKYFGEGIAFLNNKIYQLTYKTKIGFIYDAKTFKKEGEFTFPSAEGWGMTEDSTNLIMTDGTNKLTWIDPTTLQVIKTIDVTDENGPVLQINEPEFIKGFIYANIYGTNYIIKIDPATGLVAGKFDFITLVTEQKSKSPAAKEMNGIAYDSATGRMYVTGKLWPNIYEVQFGH